MHTYKLLMEHHLARSNFKQVLSVAKEQKKKGVAPDAACLRAKLFAHGGLREWKEVVAVFGELREAGVDYCKPNRDVQVPSSAPP